MPKIVGDRVLQLQRKYLKVNFRFLQEKSKRLFVSKAKNLIGFVWLKDRNHSWSQERMRPSAFTSPRLLATNDNRTKKLASRDYKRLEFNAYFCFSPHFSV